MSKTRKAVTLQNLLREGLSVSEIAGTLNIGTEAVQRVVEDLHNQGRLVAASGRSEAGYRWVGGAQPRSSSTPVAAYCPRQALAADSPPRRKRRRRRKATKPVVKIIDSVESRMWDLATATTMAAVLRSAQLTGRSAVMPFGQPAFSAVVKFLRRLPGTIPLPLLPAAGVDQSLGILDEDGRLELIVDACADGFTRLRTATHSRQGIETLLAETFGLTLAQNAVRASATASRIPLGVSVIPRNG